MFNPALLRLLCFVSLACSTADWSSARAALRISDEGRESSSADEVELGDLLDSETLETKSMLELWVDAASASAERPHLLAYLRTIEPSNLADYLALLQQLQRYGSSSSASFSLAALLQSDEQSQFFLTELLPFTGQSWSGFFLSQVSEPHIAQTVRFPSGLRVVVTETMNSDSFRVLFRINGALWARDFPGGTSHLVEHLVARTLIFDKPATVAALDVDAWNVDELTAYFVDLADAKSLVETVSHFALAVRQASSASPEVIAEEVARIDYEMFNSDVYTDSVSDAAQSGNPFPLQGSQHSLSGIRPELLEEFLRSYYGLDEMTVVLMLPRGAMSPERQEQLAATVNAVLMVEYPYQSSTKQPELLEYPDLWGKTLTVYGQRYESEALVFSMPSEARDYAALLADQDIMLMTGAGPAVTARCVEQTAQDCLLKLQAKILAMASNDAGIWDRTMTLIQEDAKKEILEVRKWMAWAATTAHRGRLPLPEGAVAGLERYKMADLLNWINPEKAFVHKDTTAVCTAGCRVDPDGQRTYSVTSGIHSGKAMLERSEYGEFGMSWNDIVSFVQPSWYFARKLAKAELAVNVDYRVNFVDGHDQLRMVAPRWILSIFFPDSFQGTLTPENDYFDIQVEVDGADLNVLVNTFDVKLEMGTRQSFGDFISRLAMLSRVTPEKESSISVERSSGHGVSAFTATPDHLCDGLTNYHFETSIHFPPGESDAEIASFLLILKFLTEHPDLSLKLVSPIISGRTSSPILGYVANLRINVSRSHLSMESVSKLDITTVERELIELLQYISEEVQNVPDFKFNYMKRLALRNNEAYPLRRSIRSLTAERFKILARTSLTLAH